MPATDTLDYSFSALIGAPIPYSLGDDDFRCPHCKCKQKGSLWVSLAGDCAHCGNCWSDAFTVDAAGNFRRLIDPNLDLLFTSVAEHLADAADMCVAENNRELIQNR